MSKESFSCPKDTDHDHGRECLHDLSGTSLQTNCIRLACAGFFVLIAVAVGFVADLQEKGAVVCFIGDGSNDGPALIRADLGIGIGSRENTLALDSSGVILMKGGLSALPAFISIGRKAARTIQENLFLASFINLALILLAASGILSPVAGAAGHQVATITVLLNSLRLAGHSAMDNKNSGQG